MRLDCLAAAAFVALAAPHARADAEAPKFIVAIDPGHGGPFPHEGAHGPRGVFEKNVTLAIAKDLARVVETELGGKAFLTRDGDVDVGLADRPALANEKSADLLISIHCNSMPTTADRKSTRGVESYSLSPDPTDAEARILAERENAEPLAPAQTSADPVAAILDDLAVSQAHHDSTPLAAFLQKHLVRATRSPNRGVRQAPFIVLAGARMPAALVEVGFISHPGEGRLLGKAKYQEKVARALADGIAEFRRDVALRREQGHAPAAAVAAAPAAPSEGAAPASAVAAAPAPAPAEGAAPASAVAAAPAPAPADGAAPASPQ